MAMIEKPQFGAITAAGLDTIGGRTLLIQAHMEALDKALDKANAVIAAQDATIALLKPKLVEATKAEPSLKSLDGNPV